MIKDLVNVLLITIVILIIVALFINYSVYHANVIVPKKISKKFNMTVDEFWNSGKDKFYKGIENGSNRIKYIIILNVDKQTYIVYEDEGISENEALSIAKDEGYNPHRTLLLVWHSFTGKNNKGLKDIKNHMYWCIYEENGYEAPIFIHFLDGHIKETE